MSHAVLSLRAKGPQDAILTVSPDITFFKTVYPRHTNYAFEDTEVSISSGVCGFNRTIEFQLPKSGDLISRTYVVIKLPALIEPASTTPTLGAAWWKIFSPYYSDLGRILLKKIEFRIGGYTVEELTGEFLRVWDELTRRPDASYVRAMPGEHGGEFDPLSSAHPGLTPAFVYVPLDFSFCNDNGQSLPMIALQYHDARIRITTCTKDEIFTRFVGGPEYAHTMVSDTNGRPISWDSTAVTKTDTTVGVPAIGGAGYRDSMIAKFDDTLMKMSLVCRYVYLDDFERRQFATNPHEYLITQVQQYDHFVQGETQVDVALPFSHPVKELLFWYKADARVTSQDSVHVSGCTHAPWNFRNTASTFGDGHLFATCNMSLNSQTMYNEGRDPEYFKTVLPLTSHTSVPRLKHVYVIPFCLDPETWKPTGSINFSRLDSVKLHLKGLGTTLAPLPKGVISMYARSFNILKITNGMGGLRFAS